MSFLSHLERIGKVLHRVLFGREDHFDDTDTPLLVGDGCFVEGRSQRIGGSITKERRSTLLGEETQGHKRFKALRNRGRTAANDFIYVGRTPKAIRTGAHKQQDFQLLQGLNVFREELSYGG